MPEYYVDTRIGEIVRKEDLNFGLLAPELYYEYRCGILEDIIIEEWYCSNDTCIDFTTKINNPYKNIERREFFKEHKVSPLYLRVYTVPPTWYAEETKRAEKNRDLEEDD